MSETKTPAKTPTPAAPADLTTTPSRERALLLVHLATLAIAGIMLVWFGRNQWFGSDEWDALARRSVLGGGDLGLLAPHNEHWSTFGVLLYRAHLAVFGLRTYLPLMAVFVAMHLLAAHLLWRVMRRAGSDTLVATALVAIFAILGSTGVELLYAWNVTFSGSIACGLAALLVMATTAGWDRRDGFVWGLLVAALVFSGVGVTMSIVAVLFAWWSRGWRDGLRVASVPAIVYAVWLLGWGSDGVDRGIQSAALERIPETLWNSMTYVFELVTGWTGIGAVVVVLLVWFAFRDRSLSHRPAVLASACAIGAPLFFALTSLRRYGALGLFGVANDAWVKIPRYSYVAFALLLPLIAVAVTRAFSRRVPQTLVLLAVVALVLVHQVVALDQAEARGARTDQEVREHVVAVAALLRDGAPRVTDHPLAYCCADLDVASIERLARDGDLPDITVSRRARDAARTHLQVAFVGGADGPSGVPPALTAVDDATLAPGPGECAEVSTGPVHPVVRLDVTGRSAVIVTSPQGGPLALWLVPPSDLATADVPPSTAVPGGAALAAGLAPNLPATIKIADSGTLLVRLPADAVVRFCDVVPDSSP